MKIAVLGVQGSVEEHITQLRNISRTIDVLWVRKKEDLENADGVIIPGGESTTIGKLLNESFMKETICKLVLDGVPILATCAGTILLSQFKLLGVDVDRNAYGRQKDSFEAEIKTVIGNTRGIFIRAPLITKVFGNAEIFATFKDQIIGVKQQNILALTFHPELSDDVMIYEYFIELIEETECL